MNCYSFNTTINVSDLLTVFGYVINILLAYWLIRTVQKRADSKRFLKEHVIEEIKDCREVYRVFLKDLYNCKISARDVIPWFKNFNMRYNEISEIANKKYNIDKDVFDDFILSLNKIITNSKEFTKAFNPNDKIKLKEKTKLEIYKLQQNNSFKFNKIIVEINDY